MEDSAFMRKDIISWKINSDHEHAKNIYYIREIFKDPNCKELITREDGNPIFE